MNLDELNPSEDCKCEEGCECGPDCKCEEEKEGCGCDCGK